MSLSVPSQARAVYGELLSLARLTDGNPHLITPALCRFVVSVLESPVPERLSEIQAEKARLSPNCTRCAHPCGRFDPYDFDSPISEPEEILSAKQALLTALPAAAKKSPRPSDEDFLTALTAISIDGVSPKALAEIAEKFLP